MSLLSMLLWCVAQIRSCSTGISFEVGEELLRLSDKNCLYFEVNHNTIIPTIFHEFVHIRSRRFPHFLDRKWDHERFVAEDTLRKHEDDERN